MTRRRPADEKPKSTSEHERIRSLRELFEPKRGRIPKPLEVGIGDDAAVFAALDAPLVVSVDSHVEGVHFTRKLMTLEDAGYRATMAALSDLAAMGAEPIGVVAAITLPAGVSDEELFEIARGQRDAARESGTAIVGGNLSRGDAISITTTVLGKARRPILRSGARAGDIVWLGGPVGLAAAGLALLQAEGESRPRAPTGAKGRRLDTARGPRRPDRGREPRDLAIAAFRRPFARIELGLRAARAGATSMIDVSDGLAADLTHVATASGVDIVLDESAVSDPVLVEVAEHLGASWQDLAFQGGEDFALVATAPAGVFIEGMRQVGRCEPARAAPRVLVRPPRGRARALAPRGFDHFASRNR